MNNLLIDYSVHNVVMKWNDAACPTYIDIVVSCSYIVTDTGAVLMGELGAVDLGLDVT